jgi:hypothetical protein
MGGGREGFETPGSEYNYTGDGSMTPRSDAGDPAVEMHGGSRMGGRGGEEKDEEEADTEEDPVAFGQAVAHRKGMSLDQYLHTYTSEVRCAFFTMGSAVLGLGSSGCSNSSVRVVWQKFTLEDAIGSHAFAPREAIACV